MPHSTPIESSLIGTDRSGVLLPIRKWPEIEIISGSPDFAGPETGAFDHFYVDGFC